MSGNFYYKVRTKSMLDQKDGTIQDDLNLHNRNYINERISRGNTERYSYLNVVTLGRPSALIQAIV